MATYTHHEIPSSPETPWHLEAGTLINVSSDLVIFENPDGSETRLSSTDGSFVFDVVADTLSGNVHSLSRTNAGGTVVYETLNEVSVDAAAFYPEASGAVDLLLAGPDAATGWSGKDFLMGRAGDDTLQGSGGNDILDGGTGTDQMAGGTGDDTYVLRRGDGNPGAFEPELVTEALGEGVDTVRIEGVAPWQVQVTSIEGEGRFAIRIPDSHGKIRYTEFVARNSHDLGTDIGKRIEKIAFDDGTVWDLTGPLTLTGADTFYGSEYGDTLTSSGARTTVYAATGDDTVHGNWGVDEIFGGEGNDVLEGGDNNDTLQGGTGNDTLRGSDGQDSLSGGADDDELRGGAGEDTVDGGAGNDFLDGGDDNDILIGGAGNNDMLGGSGDDRFEGGLGTDVMRGGTGDDTYRIERGDGQLGNSNEYDVIIENIGEGIDTVRIVGVAPSEVVAFTTFDSPAIRLGIPDGDGNLRWTDIATQRSAGGVDIGQRVERVVFDDGTVWDLTGPLNFKVFSSLYGSPYDDTLQALDSPTELDGRNGNDTLRGGATGDFLSGRNGNDLLEGNGGNDNLVGGAGDDILRGGAGADQMAGGAGDDTYILRAGDGGSGITSSTEEVISEKSNEGLDTVQLEGLTPADVKLVLGGITPNHVRLEIKAADGSLSYVELGHRSSINIELIKFDNGTVWDLREGLPPAATDDEGGAVPFNTPMEFEVANLLANDSAPGEDSLSLVSVSDAVNGFVKLNADGNPAFTPSGGYSGPASFQYRVSDGTVTSTATVNLTVGEPDAVKTGAPGTDNLAGTSGADHLFGMGGNDTLSGGAGNDALDGGQGADMMLGRDGHDSYEVDNVDDAAIEGPNGGIDEVHSSINYTLGTYVENLTLTGETAGTGNKFDNRLTGSDQANALSGGIGRDRLDGGAGDDTLTGGRDSDTFVFKEGFGHDVITDFAVANSYSAIGPSHDVLEFDADVFADSSAFFAASADTTDGVLVMVDADNSLLIRGTTVAQLTAYPEDFQFV
jgi:Ca2+-binding RTX toxin-like protein